MLTSRNVSGALPYTPYTVTSLCTNLASGGIARSKGIARLRVAILRLIEREASVVMWHNQRVINTPNHRYNYASDPRAIPVPLVAPLPQADVIFAAMGHVDAIDGERSPRTHPVARRSRGARRA